EAAKWRSHGDARVLLPDGRRRFSRVCTALGENSRATGYQSQSVDAAQNESELRVRCRAGVYSRLQLEEGNHDGHTVAGVTVRAVDRVSRQAGRGCVRLSARWKVGA